MARKSKEKRDGIYQREDRDGFWITWTDAQGRRRRRKTDAQNITQARNILNAEKARVERARELGFSPPGKDSFEAVAKRYLAHQKVRVSRESYLRERVSLERHLMPFFAGKIASIRRSDVQRYVTKRSGDISPATVRKELNTLTHLLSLAAEWEIIPFNPGQRVKSPKLPAGRVRYLQPTELRALIEASLDWLKPIVALAASTGMRRSEIVGLRWLDVDMLHGRIMLRQTKNGEGRIVYLNKSAQSAIASLPIDGNTKPTDRLFPGVTGPRVQVAFTRTCKALGLADFHFHDLRHTAASWLRMSGADIHTVASLLGHKDLRMAARYQHLSPAFLAEAVGKLDSVFGHVDAVLDTPSGVEIDAEIGAGRHHSVTTQRVLPAVVSVSD
jgi:integrase